MVLPGLLEKSRRVGQPFSRRAVGTHRTKRLVGVFHRGPVSLFMAFAQPGWHSVPVRACLPEGFWQALAARLPARGA